MENKRVESIEQALDAKDVDSKTFQKSTNDEKLTTATNTGIAIGLTEISGRYGESAKEFLVALDGVDNATGKTLHRSLKDIAKYKINPEFEEQNLKQQAGYSAEISSVAKKNAENIINNKQARYTRTDDLGSVNDQFVDIVALDGSEAIQMKMVGNNPQGCLDTLSKSNYEKYLYSDKVSSIEIPKEYFADVKILCDSKIQNLTEQIQTMQKRGVSPEVIEKIKKQLEKYKLIKEKISESELTIGDALEARQNPEKYTYKQMARNSHRAGLRGAKIGRPATESNSFCVIP